MAFEKYKEELGGGRKKNDYVEAKARKYLNGEKDAKENGKEEELSNRKFINGIKKIKINIFLKLILIMVMMARFQSSSVDHGFR